MAGSGRRGRDRVQLLRANQRQEMISYIREVLIKRALKFAELKPGTIVARVPAATLKPEVQAGNGPQFGPTTHFLVSNIVAARVDHIDSC